jgi:hypothetical protein
MTGTNYADIIYSQIGDKISDLDTILENAPASPLTNFLKLYQLKKNRDPAFLKSAQKTVLYFNNPHWLQFQLSNANSSPFENSTSDLRNESGHFAVVLPENQSETNEVSQDESIFSQTDTNKPSEDGEVNFNNIPVEETDNNLRVEKEAEFPSQEESHETPVDNIGGEEFEETEEAKTETFAEETLQPDELTAGTNYQEDQLSEPKQFETPQTEIESSNVSLNKNEHPSREVQTQDFEANTNINIDTEVAFEPKEPVLEEDHEKNSLQENQKAEENIAFQPEPEHDIDMENLEETSHETEQNEEVAFEPKEPVLEEDHEKNSLQENQNSEENIAFEPGPEPDIKMEQLEKSSQETEENEEVAFEPLHTVDYFASQGIRIREDMLTNDKLGKQVKSFTDWLKTMKKLHPGKLPEQNEVIEKIIQSSAEESNADAEVLTEAMAEVLIKQNKQEKAIEMYEKLSLMNPSKSAYFAAKIESIKTN